MKYSVSELNRKINSYIDNEEFQDITVFGEISEIKYYPTKGHCYFSIKDNDALIKCVAFGVSKYIKFPLDLKNGDKIELKGDLTFYEKGGTVQIRVKSLEKENEMGDLLKKLEALKEEFYKKGYFDKEIKKEIPYFLNKIGIVTAINSAALQDMIKTKNNRNPNVDFYVYNAKVQGIGSSLEIAKGIEELNKIEEIQVIIIGRGGGSKEDLFAFNEREVIEAIHLSKKPIISAVGHEIDFHLSDLAADLSVSTPTQAIEKLVIDKNLEISKLISRKTTLNKYANNSLLLNTMKLDNIKKSHTFESIKNIVEYKLQDLIIKESKLKSIITPIITDLNNDLIMYKNNLKNYLTKNILENKNMIYNIKEKLEYLSNENLNKKKVILNELSIKLSKYSTDDILNRGYSITLDSKGNIIKSVKGIRKNTDIITVLKDGKINSKINEVKR